LPEQGLMGLEPEGKAPSGETRIESAVTTRVITIKEEL
jgi:hypothetical protein